jgi:hypothetical protein
MSILHVLVIYTTSLFTEYTNTWTQNETINVEIIISKDKLFNPLSILCSISRPYFRMLIFSSSATLNHFTTSDLFLKFLHTSPSVNTYHVNDHKDA